MTPVESFEKSVADLGPVLAEVARQEMGKNFGIDLRFITGLGDHFTLRQAVARRLTESPGDALHAFGLAAAIFTASIAMYDFHFDQEGRLCFRRRGI